MTAVIERKFDKNQLRDLGGEGGGQWVSDPASAVKDALKLAGKIDLGENEKLVGSAKVSADGGTVRLAAVASGDKRRLRIGIGDGAFGGREDEAGPWRGGPDRTAETNAEAKKLRDEQEAIERELDALDGGPGADPARKADLQRRFGEIEDLGTGDVYPAGFTADVDATDLERFRAVMPEALAKAAKTLAVINDFWNEHDRLERERNKLRGMPRKWTDEEDARWDDLTAQLAEMDANQPDWEYEVFAEGVVPGRWADVHYRVEIDDPSMGVTVLLGAVPHDHSDLGTLEDMFGNEQGATLDPGETKKFLRLLDRFSTGPAPTTRSTVLRYDADQHRGYHGRWAHVGGFNMDGLTGVTHVEGAFGDLAMGVDPAGDIRVAFHEGGEVRELGLSAEDLEDLSSRLFTFSAGRSRIDDEAASDDVIDDDSWGVDQDHRIEMYGSGLISVIFGAEGDDPTTLNLDPPYEADPDDPEDVDFDDVDSLIEGIDEVLAESAAQQAQRARSPEQGGAAAAPAGGQFALGGGRVGAKGKSKQRRRPASAKPKPAPHAPAAPAGPMAFDGKRGTGYGVKGGDPRVRTLQSALNRLGLADSSGASLVLDGRYGPRTTSSVKKLQKALGLKPDGKVTPELLKQATELKQLPAKPAAKPRAPRKAKTRRTAAAKRSQVLASIARALGEHYIADGICVACGEPEGDEAVRALVEAFDEIERVRHVRTEAGARKYGLPIGSIIGGGSGSAHAPMVAKAAGAGRTSLTDRLVNALQAHHAGRGAGDPFDGYDREQLRKVAKARGVKLDRGEGRESISKKLLDHLGPGRSASESDAAPKVVDRRPAKDISNDVDFKTLPASYNPKTGENDALKAIIDRQGFNGRPMVVSAGDFDAALRRGEVRETWRGLATPARMANASGLAEQFRTGDFHVGHGINGDGTYVAISKGDGEYYGSTLLRIGLRKDAKVISADELDREMDAYFAGLKSRHTSAELRRLDEKLLKDLATARTARGRANIRRTYRNAVDGLDPDRSVALQRDPGIFAALRGYDAIEISKARSPDKHHEMILLNRAATIVQEA